MELRLGRIVVLLGLVAHAYQLADRIGVGLAALQAVAQVQGALLIFVGALPGGIAHGDDADQVGMLLPNGLHGRRGGDERAQVKSRRR